jgi:hypothetical protein
LSGTTRRAPILNPPGHTPTIAPASPTW